ncbi:MAG: CAP domain-containing protein, partial [Acetatifactor sp.]|nr:CAP domain-containing protein [Acetatifactor sp.]
MIVKGKIRKRIALLLAMVMALSMELMHVAAADEGSGQMEVSLNVTYGQTDARAMLDMINDFRTGGDAWALNSAGEKVTYTDLGELTYDYDLEQIAMQRAAEIAISFLHTRPNGEDSSTATCNGTRSSAENIAVGYGSQGKIDKIFNFLQETDEGYSGQIHRRIMLSGDYTAVGIGHVRYKGMDYWVQEFGTASNSTETACVDGDASVPVSIATSKIESPSLAVD